MTEFKYCVYCEEEPAICFDNEADAMKFAREDTSMYKEVRVEKTEVDEDGDVLNSEVIWSTSNVLSDGTVKDEKDNPFETEFPKSDIEDISEIDDEEYEKMYQDYLDSQDVPADWDDPNRFPPKTEDLNIKEAVKNLEEHEDEVECKCCFDLFPKADCIKTEDGYVCKKCNQELHSHQGTNLDLIDNDPFSLDYEDPRDFDEPEETEVKEEPVNANEVRKFEAGIEEKLNEDVMSLADQVGNRCLDFWESQRDIGKWNPQAMAEYGITDPEEYADYVVKNIWTVDDIYASIKDKVQGEESEVKKLIDAWMHDSLEFEVESLKEHINDRPADIESKQVLQGTDNAVVDCKTDQKVIAHSEDEKPLDCKMEKPALEEPLAGKEVDVKLNEDLKVIIDFSEYKPWSGAVDTYELIKDADKLDELEAYLEECYPDGVTATQINDILWFDSDQVLSYLGLGDVEDEEVDESLQEAKKDDELPVDPEAAKLEVHTMLNDLVADEIEAINGYEEAKKEILDTPIAHKDNILDTIDHVEDEEKEHVDELISATTEIPFDKEEAPAPAVEEPAVEEEPLDQEFPEVEEDLKEAAPDTPFDSDIKEGDKIRIVHLEGEDNSYDGKEGTVEHIDDLGQLHGSWGGLAVIPGVDDFDIITEEELKEAKAKPEADKVQCYNDGLKLAKAYNKPVIYGYTNSSYNGKFFKLDDPIICDNVSDETKKFKQQYKSCNVVYVAYPSGQLIERLLEELPEGTTEVDYVEYKHSYCHALEPKLEELKKIEDIEELKKAILDIINNDPQVNWTKKEKKFAAIVRHKKWKSVEDLKAYLDNSIAKAREIKVSVDTDGELVKKLTEEIEFDENGDEIFTPEEQEEFDCDEWGYSNEGYDQFHHCGWCEEIYPESEMRHEVDFGWICSRCEDELKSHGGPLTFIEEELKDKE